MPKIISGEAFVGELGSLNHGELAHHSMVFPGVYPSDREIHEQALRGIPFTPEADTYVAVSASVEKGARFQWLRVLPKPGEFSYTAEDVRAMRLSLGLIANIGFDVRTVYYSDHADRILEYCGESPVAQDFLDGLDRGDPRKSSWAMFRRGQLGKLTLDYLSTMDYRDGEFQGHVRHELPVDEHIAKWTFAWRETYEEFGEPL